MLLRGKSKERNSSRKVTPPSPTYMNNEQFAAYLANLRDNRVNRPSGARPQPQTQPSNSRRDSGRTSLGGRPSLGSPVESDSSSTHQRTQSDVPSMSSRSYVSASMTSRYSTVGGHGRDYYPDHPTKPLKPSMVVPSATYIERGQRWMEKEEAVSLKHAIEDMDLRDKPPMEEDQEEKRIHEAALNEAAELVWQHQNPGKIPQPGAPYRYRQHLRKNSYAHARTASVGAYGDDIVPTGLARDPSSRSVSGSSTDSGRFSSARSRSSFGSTTGGRESLEQPRKSSGEARPPKPYGGISGGPFAIKNHRRRSSMKRNISGEVEKPFSGDQIWEEPEGGTPDKKAPSKMTPAASKVDEVEPLRVKPKNPLNRVQFAPEVPVPDSPEANPPRKLVSKYEIHRNPPTQSRNPQYTTNSGPARKSLEQDSTARKHGMEVRSGDIREATSMRLKDRSPKLPTPTAVSDNPGRPIVSFNANWKAPEEATDDKPEDSRRALPPLVAGGPVRQEPQGQAVPFISVTEDRQAAPSSSPSRRSQQPPPTIQVGGQSGPSIPVISVSDSTPSIPSIVLPDGPEDSSIPVIITPDENNSSSSSRPLPTPGGNSRPRQAARPRGHWSPAAPPVGSRATARCHECSHPIEGRFVALAGCSERFHPACFTCYDCGTPLEALEISPEPEDRRAARLDRIARRTAGELLEEAPGETMAEDGDARRRFYCHLDWHERFAPRCRHCRTPILGEHVVALGAAWHPGHFFCAECGDPFPPGATHIEVDGYAWCVSCQTRRTERRAPKCRACKGPVIGEYVQALGGEWHDGCFRCATCGGGFDDGQIFPCEDSEGRTAVFCTRCRERELKR